jgi:hypothetical protein
MIHNKYVGENMNKKITAIFLILCLTLVCFGMAGANENSFAVAKGNEAAVPCES